MKPAPFRIDSGEAEAWTGGTWHGDQREVTIYGAVVDSRLVSPGCCFVCVPGRRVDGHDFAETAVGDGAAMVLAERELDVPVPVLVVGDVTVALGQLAARFRASYQGATWIGVAGANGKTTVKELLRAACSEQGPTHATEGNRNNDLGLPMTVLATPPDCRWVVGELGANKPGEIAALAHILQPDVGVLTGIGPAHLEGYGSLMGVAQGEADVFTQVPTGGACLFGRYGLDEAAAAAGEDAAALEAVVVERASGRHLVIVGGPTSPVTGSVDPHGIDFQCGEGSVRIPLLGAHNLANVALAWRAALAAGVNPEVAMRGLPSARPVPGRLRLVTLGEHRLFDDCYNANPASMRAGLEELSRQPGARLAVLGAMGELGSDAARHHRRVGSVAARLGLPVLVVGTGLASDIASGYREAGGRDIADARDVRAAIAHINERLAVGPTALLVKASHAAGLERVVAALESGEQPC